MYAQLGIMAAPHHCMSMMVPALCTHYALHECIHNIHSISTASKGEL